MAQQKPRKASLFPEKTKQFPQSSCHRCFGCEIVALVNIACSRHKGVVPSTTCSSQLKACFLFFCRRNTTQAQVIFEQINVCTSICLAKLHIYFKTKVLHLTHLLYIFMHKGAVSILHIPYTNSLYNRTRFTLPQLAPYANVLNMVEIYIFLFSIRKSKKLHRN